MVSMLNNVSNAGPLEKVSRSIRGGTPSGPAAEAMFASAKAACTSSGSNGSKSSFVSDDGSGCGQSGVQSFFVNSEKCLCSLSVGIGHCEPGDLSFVKTHKIMIMKQNPPELVAVVDSWG